MSEPGAFWVSGQMEQHSFNWVTTFAPGVSVLRDKAYNVAYWNLHGPVAPLPADWTERMPINAGRWTGAPLVTFHYSGFSPDRPSSLSYHDARYSIYLLPSVAHLLEFYRKELRENGADEDWDTDYPFDRFPSGCCHRQRYAGQSTRSSRPICPLTSIPGLPECERYYCQAILSPMPQSGSLIPILFRYLYDQRPDLQSLYPGAHVEPQSFLPWISSHGIFECGYEELFDRHRPCSPTREGANALLAAKKKTPKAFAGPEASHG